MVKKTGGNNEYDIIIIGAGPIGMVCAIAAKKAGLKHMIIEKGVLVNSLYHFPTNMTFFSTSNLLEIGDVPFISHGDKPTRRESLEYFRRVHQAWDLNIHFYERVEELNPNSNAGYRITTDKGNYTTDQVVIATGFYDTPNLMHVPGEELPKVKHYYDEPHPYVGQRLAIVGAANSACDVALEAFQKGAEVTMIIREPEIYPRVKYWIKPNIENRIKEGSIKAFFNTTLREVREKEIVINTPQGEKTLPNDFVLAMTGYRPDYPLLEKMGIAFHDDEYRTPVWDEETLETNLPGVYLAGVVNGGLKTNRFFIENTRDHGDLIVNHIMSKVKKK